MFTRDSQTSPRDMYYADTLLTKPTTKQSVFDNLTAGFLTPAVWAGDLQQLFTQRPEGNPLRNLVEGVDIMNQTPGMSWGQGAANELSNMVGFGLNPVTWGFGALGGAAADVAVSAGSKVLPEAANVFLRKPLAEVFGEPLGKYVPSIKVAGEEMPLTSALLGKKYAETFGTFAGAGVPAAWYANYNQDTKHIDWGGGATDLAKMGAFGLAVQTIPFAWGVLKARINRATGKPVNASLELADYNKALEDGLISKEEHAWITDYLTNPLETPDLKQRASQILASTDAQPNMATHEVPVEIMSPEQIENLKSALADQSLSDLPDEVKTSLSDYLVHNSLDGFREKPTMVDGLRGYRDFIDEKLQAKSEKLAQVNKMLDDHLLKSVNENMPFSQKEMLKTMRQFGFESSHVKNIPITIPENVARQLKIREEIVSLEGDITSFRKKYSRARNPKYTDQISDLQKRVETLNKNIKSYVDRMNRTDEAKRDVKDLEERAKRYQDQIEELKVKDKLVTSGKRYLEKITEKEKKIASLEADMPKVLTPKEELQHLRNKLLTEKGLPNKWERSNAYHRLVDLSHVWHNAKTLLDRVHLEAAYEKQEAFRNLADSVLQIADSNVARLANRNNVVNYLRDRIQSKTLEVKPNTGIDIKMSEQRQVPANADELLDMNEVEINKVGTKELSKEFGEMASRFKEFKANENVFKNLIQCVLGGMNG